MKINLLTISYSIFLLFVISLFVGFLNQEAISGAGAKKDFYFTWNYVLALEKNMLTDPTTWTVHTPLHYFVLFNLYKVLNSQEAVRFAMVVVSFLIPILFYYNLRIKFPKVGKSILLIFATSIFLYPSFRYSALWANSHITALIFFLLSTYYFLVWEKSSSKTITLPIVLSTICLTLAVYTRQYYAFIFFYYLSVFFLKLYIKDFLKLCFFIFILTLPGFYLIYEYPLLVKNAFFTLRYQNTLLINSSIISFYLIPFFLIFCFSKDNVNIIKKDLISFLFLSINISWLVSFNGPSSPLIGFFMILLICREDIKNIIIFLILLLCFSGYIIYQKNFEPMFLIILFLLINTKLTNNFLKEEKNMILYYFYIVSYLASAILNDYFHLSSKILN